MRRRWLLPALLSTTLLAACGDRGPAHPDATPDAPLDALADASLDAPSDAPAPDAADVVVDTGPPPPSHPAAAPLVQWASPFMGTGGVGYGTGSAFPGPQTPFGMARPGPDTTTPMGAADFAHCSGYAHDDTLIQGFSLTRMHGTGITDYGAIALMPVVGMTAAKTTQAGYLSRFDHATERASPGYYAVHLADSAIDVELTATDHVALQRYTFPAASDGVVVLDLGHTIGEDTIGEAHLQRDAATGELSGSVRFLGGYSARCDGVTVYFAARASRPFASAGTFASGALQEGGTAADGTAVGAYLRFDTSTDRAATVAVGLSFVDVARARANLAAEVPAIDFDTVRHATEAAWEHALSVVHVEGRYDADFRTFYSALYHTLLMPTLATDVDGSYRGLDGQVHTADGYRYYTDFSLWDTYRTEHPLITWLYPSYALDFARSLVAMIHDDGTVPRWPLGTCETGGMLGDSADIVLADGWIKGVRDFDLRGAYPAMRALATGTPTPNGQDARTGVANYLAHGYVTPEDGSKSVSNTLEYAYDDSALAVLADALGESADAAMFRTRVHDWRNHFDAASGFLLARHADGSFVELASPTAWQPYYAEGDAWQYDFYAPYDLDGMVAAFGGRDATRARLDMLFAQTQRRGTAHVAPMPYFWPGNEPDLAVPWLYAALDDGADAGRWTRWVAKSFFSSAPDGLPGNDDGGTMSAWFVFASVGLYPFAATPDYMLGAPLFTRVELALARGTVTIDAPDESDAAFTVRQATWNGTALEHPRLTHDALAAGGTLHLDMQ